MKGDHAAVLPALLIEKYPHLNGHVYAEDVLTGKMLAVTLGDADKACEKQKEQEEESDEYYSYDTEEE